MSKLANAPLIEVVVQLVWGMSAGTGEDGSDAGLDLSEARFLPGYFAAEASKAGFGHIEFLSDEEIPHVPSIRFREGEDAWPCYQIGPGILTINQANDGYDWEQFKGAVLRAVQILKQSYAWGEENLPVPQVELTYSDGFTLDGDQGALDFLNNNLRLQIAPPAGLLDERFGSGLRAVEMSFEVEVRRPEAVLVLEVTEGTINGRPGFVLDTTIQSAGPGIPLLGGDLADWLDEAHEIQRHAFKTLIDPAYARRFE